MSRQYQYSQLVGPVLVPAAVAFNPALLDWLPDELHRGRRLYSGRLADFSAPSFQALYKPETLSWLPSSRQPARSLPPRYLGDFAQPPFESLYKPADLGWLPSSRQPARSLAPRHLGDFQQPPFVSLYVPGNLDWLSYARQPARTFAPRFLGDFSQPSFDSLYKPHDLGWLPSAQYPARGLPSGDLVSYAVLDPFPVAPPFDPSELSWISVTPQVGAQFPRRQQPNIVESLFLEPVFVHGPATPSPVFFEGKIFQYQEIAAPVFIPQPFDPVSLSWAPSLNSWPIHTERRRYLAFIEPIFIPSEDVHGPTISSQVFFEGKRFQYQEIAAPVFVPVVVAPYDPSKIEWVPSARAFPRGLPKTGLGAFSIPHLIIPDVPPVVVPPVAPRGGDDVWRKRIEIWDMRKKIVTLRGTANEKELKDIEDILTIISLLELDGFDV